MTMTTRRLMLTSTGTALALPPLPLLALPLPLLALPLLGRARRPPRDRKDLALPVPLPSLPEPTPESGTWLALPGCSLRM